MDDTTYETVVRDTRRKYAMIGAAVGGLYAELVVAGVDEESRGYLCSRTLDRLLDTELPHQQVSVRIHNNIMQHRE